MGSVIDYTEGTSFLHKANPVAKLVFALELFAAAFAAQGTLEVLAVLALTICVGVVSQNAQKTFKLVFGFAVLGLILCVVQTLVAPAGQMLFLFITVGGLERGFNVALKTIALALPLLSMLSLMRVEDLMNALVEVAHVPYPYAFTIATVLRFVPVFASEMNHIMEAQMARGVEFDTKNPLKKLQLTMPLIVPLLVSSVKKADASALAAEQRGFYLRNASSAFKRYPLAPSDFALMILGVAVIVVIPMFS